MHSATHRLNHDFQLQHFLANACRTVDGAYALLYAQKVDMESKLKSSEVADIKREIRKLKAEEILNNEASSKIERLEAKAELIELESSEYVYKMNLEGAKNELAFIEKLMAELEPQRKYSHLPILEANEACQREEWLEELKFRAENYILSCGTIPADHLATMRHHPDFITDLAPHIMQITEAVSKSKDFKTTCLKFEKQPLLLTKE